MHLWKKREDGSFDDICSIYEPKKEEENTNLDFDFDDLEEFKDNTTILPSTRRLLSTAKNPVAHYSTCKTYGDSLANSLGNVSLKTHIQF